MLAVPPCLSCDLLLIIALERAVLLRLFPERLHGIHDVGLLGEEGIPEIRRPLNFICELVNYSGKVRQCLHTGVQVLLRDRFGQRFVVQFLVLIQPLFELNYFERISRSSQDLDKERVGVKRDGCD